MDLGLKQPGFIACYHNFSSSLFGQIINISEALFLVCKMELVITLTSQG